MHYFFCSTGKLYAKLLTVLEVLKQYFQSPKEEEAEKSTNTLFSKLGNLQHHEELTL